MKKFAALAAALAVMTTASAAFAQDVTVKVNGEAVVFDQQPVIEGDRLLLPFRFIAEKLGANVSWYEDNSESFAIRQVLCQKGDNVTVMQIGNQNIFVNDSVINLETAPVIIGDRTLVPAAAIEGATGAAVEWNKDAAEVNVTLAEK